MLTANELRFFKLPLKFIRCQPFWNATREPLPIPIAYWAGPGDGFLNALSKSSLALLLEPPDAAGL